MIYHLGISMFKDVQDNQYIMYIIFLAQSKHLVLISGFNTESMRNVRAALKSHLHYYPALESWVVTMKPNLY